MAKCLANVPTVPDILEESLAVTVNAFAVTVNAFVMHITHNMFCRCRTSKGGCQCDSADASFAATEACCIPD